MTDIPWAAVITAISTLAGVYITHAITARRSLKSRIWDLRLEIYATALGSLREAEYHFEDLADAIDAEDETEAARLTSLIVKEMELSRRELGGRGIILPNNFTEAYNRFADAMVSASPDVPNRAERARQSARTIDEHRRVLKNIARGDLGV